MSADRVLTIDQAAELIGCRKSLVYKLLTEGRIRHCRVGLGRGRYRVTEADVREYLDSCEVAPVEPGADVAADESAQSRRVRGLVIRDYVGERLREKRAGRA